jgi:hypothetical protein
LNRNLDVIVRVLFFMNQRFFPLFELVWLVLQGELFNALKADDCFCSVGANLNLLVPCCQVQFLQWCFYSLQVITGKSISTLNEILDSHVECHSSILVVSSLVIIIPSCAVVTRWAGWRSLNLALPFLNCENADFLTLMRAILFKEFPAQLEDPLLG